MGTNRTPSAEAFDAILGDLPTLATIQLRYGTSPSTVIRRRLAAGANPAAIATEFRCLVVQVERWIALLQATSTFAAKPTTFAPRPPSPVVGRKATKLKDLLPGILGDRERALQLLQQAGSLTKLHASLNLGVHFATFYGVVRQLYGKDFATSVVHDRPAKAISPPKRQTSESVATRLQALLGSRDDAITRLNAVGSASALMAELNLGASYPTFNAALRKLYGEDIISTIVHPKRATASKPSDRTPVITPGMGRGTVVQAVAQAFSQTRDWPATARRLNTTLDGLREIVNKNPADFAGSIGSDYLRVLLKKERPNPVKIGRAHV